jgi:hypothetical protein
MKLYSGLVGLLFCAQMASIKPADDVLKSEIVSLVKEVFAVKSIAKCALIFGGVSGLASYMWAKYKKPLRDKSAIAYSAVEKLMPLMTSVLLYALLKMGMKAKISQIDAVKANSVTSFLATFLSITSCPVSLLGSYIGYKAGIASN